MIAAAGDPNPPARILNSIWICPILGRSRAWYVGTDWLTVTNAQRLSAADADLFCRVRGKSCDGICRPNAENGIPGSMSKPK
jgi:hypothetical protein